MNSKRTEDADKSEQQVTRRQFVKSTALGSGAVMAAAVAGPVAGKLPDVSVPSNTHTTNSKRHCAATGANSVT